jgi:hypothetical protein
MANIREEETIVEGDVGGIHVGRGVGRALIRVPLLFHVRLATLLLVVALLLHLLLPLIVVLITITCLWTFSNIMTGLTTLVENPLKARFIILPFPLLEDLLEPPNDKSNLLVVKLGGNN